MSWNDLWKDQAVLDQNTQIGPSACVMAWAERTFPLARAPKLLDIGCGTCRTAFALAERGATVHACDHAKSIIDHLNSAPELRSKVASLSVCEADDLKFYDDQSFHGVFSDGVLFYLNSDRIRAAFHEMFRVLQPGGAAFCRTICVDDKRNKGSDSTDYGLPITLLTATEICRFAEESGFLVLSLLRDDGRQGDALTKKPVLRRGVRHQDWLISLARPFS